MSNTYSSQSTTHLINDRSFMEAPIAWFSLRLLRSPNPLIPQLSFAFIFLPSSKCALYCAEINEILLPSKTELRIKNTHWDFLHSSIRSNKWCNKIYVVCLLCAERIKIKSLFWRLRYKLHLDDGKFAFPHLQPKYTLFASQYDTSHLNMRCW